MGFVLPQDTGVRRSVNLAELIELRDPLAPEVAPGAESMLTEQAGVKRVGAIVTGDLRWVFREQPPPDWGIDAHIETVVGTPTGRLLGLQIKSGPSYFDEPLRDGSGWTTRIEDRHRAYWLAYSLPVLVVLVNDRGEVFWEAVSNDRLVPTEASWKLAIRRDQRLDAAAVAELRALADAGSVNQARLNRLGLDLPLMRLAEAGALYLAVDEWVHRGSGVGRFTLLRSDGAEEVVLQDWREFSAVPWAESARGPRLFPWATLTPDIDSVSLFDDDAMSADPDDPADALDVGVYRPFNAPRDLSVQYRLRVGLNDLGRSFLHVDAHLNQEPR